MRLRDEPDGIGFWGVVFWVALVWFLFTFTLGLHAQVRFLLEKIRLSFL